MKNMELLFVFALLFILPLIYFVVTPIYFIFRLVYLLYGIHLFRNKKNVDNWVICNLLLLMSLDIIMGIFAVHLLDIIKIW